MNEARSTRLVSAAVCRGFGAPLALEQVALRSPQGREVEVAIDAVAICHSDISLAEGAWGGALPSVFGHEAAGRVVATGPGVVDIGPGDAVIVTLIRHCGTCGACGTGRPVLCEAKGAGEGPLTTPSGEPMGQGLSTAAFAERVVVDRSQVVRVPADVAAEAACLLACGVLTGVGAVVNTARLRAGEDVVVVGAGGVGLNAIQGARIAGARRIVAVDVSGAKLESALEFGATDAVLADEAPWKAVRAALGRGADAVLVTVGAVAAYETATRYLGAGGRLIAVGMPHSGQTASWEPVVLAALGQSVTGSLMGDCIPGRDVAWLVDLYRQGRLKLDELISGRWPLDRINDAIADTRAGQARRNVIVLR
jgi:Zn-dependent alcohol dehydrogenase